MRGRRDGIGAGIALHGDGSWGDGDIDDDAAGAFGAGDGDLWMAVMTEQAVKLITPQAGSSGDVFSGVGARGAAADDALPVERGDLATCGFPTCHGACGGEWERHRGGCTTPNLDMPVVPLYWWSWGVWIMRIVGKGATVWMGGVL